MINQKRRCRMPAHATQPLLITKQSQLFAQGGIMRAHSAVKWKVLARVVAVIISILAGIAATLIVTSPNWAI